MALEFAHGSVEWLSTDTAGTTYTISGLSFQPKAIRFYWMGHQSATDAVTQTVSERRGIGFASSTSSRRAVGTFSLDNAAAADTDGVAVNDCIAVTTTGAGAIDGKLDLNAINSDGFQLIVDDQVPASITVFWEAWGGSDITNVTIGDIAEPAATGTQNYTATGFTATDDFSQVVMFAGVQSTAAVGTAQISDSGLYVGFSTGTTTAQNIIVVGNSDESSATLDTDGYNYTGHCVAMLTVAGGNPSARATLSAFGTDLFTLNWTNRATTNRRSIYMAIKGGSWKSGALTINGTVLNSTASVSSLPFNMKGLSFMGAMKAISTAGTSTTQDRISLGSASGTGSRRAMGIWDENSTANTEINHILEYDQILAFTTNAAAPTALKDLSAYSNTTYDSSFTVIVDSTGGNASEWVGYLVSGDNVTDISIDLTITQEDDTLTGAAEEPSTEIFATLDIAEADDSFSSASAASLTDIGASAGAGTETTASFTPPDNSLLVVFGVGYYDYGGGSAGQVSISDTAGLTWTRRIGFSRASSGEQTPYYAVWTAPVTTGTSMTITVGTATGGSGSNHALSVAAITNYNSSSPVVQTKAANLPNLPDGSHSLTLDSAPSTTSMVLAARLASPSGTGALAATPGADFTELHDVVTTSALGLQTQYRSGSTSTTVNWVDVAVTEAIYTTTGVILAIEIAADSGGSGSAYADVEVFGNSTINEASDTTTTLVDVTTDSDLEATEESDTTATLVDVELFGNLSVTEDSDTVTAIAETVSNDNNATLTANEDSDTVTGEVDAEVAASGSFTEDGDTATSATDVDLFGNTNATETSDTTTTAVDVDLNSALTANEESDGLTSSSTAEIHINFSVVEDSDTLTGVTYDVLSVLSATEDSDTTTTAVDVDITGTSELSEAADTSTSSISVTTFASGNITEDADVSVAETNDAIAYAAFDEDADTTTTLVDVDVGGNLTATEADDLLVAATFDGLGSLTANEDSDIVTSDIEVVASGVFDTIESSDWTDTEVEVESHASLSVAENSDTLEGSATALGETTANLFVAEENDAISSATGVGLYTNGVSAEENDTLAGNSSQPIVAAGAITETDDDLTGSVDTEVIATAVVNEANDTLTASTADALASASLLDEDDTLTATVSIDNAIEAVADINEANDTLTASTTDALASISITEVSDNLSSTVNVGSRGTFSATEENDTSSATIVAAINVFLTLNAAHDETTTSVDVGINANLVETEENDTLTGSATPQDSIICDLEVVEDSDSIIAVLDVFISVSGSITDSDDQINSSGTTGVFTTTSSNEDNDSSTGIAIVSTTASLDVVVEDSLVGVVQLNTNASYTATDDDDIFVAELKVVSNANLESNDDSDQLSSLMFTTGAAGALNITEDSDTASGYTSKIIKRVRINGVRAPRRVVQ